mmetsp:Transcript_92416/g.287555  ORF Transcript_92416/g.287555 Transcript_92416/m.287555 type:complete len:223 (-) Transcript_92416:178-846(-)
MAPRQELQEHECLSVRLPADLPKHTPKLHGRAWKEPCLAFGLAPLLVLSLFGVLVVVRLVADRAELVLLLVLVVVLLLGSLPFALALALGRAYSPGELLSCWLKAEELVEHPPVFTELLIGVVTAGSLQHGHHAGLATLEAVLGQDRALNRQIECRALCLPAVALVALAVLLLQLPELGLEVLVGKTFIQLPLQLQCRFKREGWPARGTCLHCILGLRSLGH